MYIRMYVYLHTYYYYCYYVLNLLILNTLKMYIRIKGEWGLITNRKKQQEKLLANNG